MRDKRRSAAFLVAVFGGEERLLPAVKAARDLAHAAEIAHAEARAACRPTVRVYTGDLRLVMSLRL